MFKGTSFTLESFPHLLKLQKAFITLLIYLVTLAGHVSPSGAISALRCYSVRKIACFLSAGVRAEAGISPLCGKAVISKLAAGCDLLSCKCVSVKVCSSNASSSRHGRRVRARKGSKLLPSTTASTSHGHTVSHTRHHTHTDTPPVIHRQGQRDRFHDRHQLAGVTITNLKAPTSASPVECLSPASRGHMLASSQCSFIPTIDFFFFFACVGNIDQNSKSEYKQLKGCN